ncbi:cyclophilin-like fold protein [Microbacterium sp. NPDC055455]
MRQVTMYAPAMLVAVVLTGCGTSGDATPVPTTTGPSVTPPTEAATPVPTPTESAAVDQIVGTVVRFTSDQTTVDVTIGEDNPTVRDFLSLLPVEVALEEFNGREKIAYFSRELTTEGSPGSDPEDGDLIYYSSWGNIGFYYNADGIDYSDATVHIGTYTATADELALLEGQVMIEIVDE